MNAESDHMHRETLRNNEFPVCRFSPTRDALHMQGLLLLPSHCQVSGLVQEELEHQGNLAWATSLSRSQDQRVHEMLVVFLLCIVLFHVSFINLWCFLLFGTFTLNSRYATISIIMFIYEYKLPLVHPNLGTVFIVCYEVPNFPKTQAF